MDAPLILLFPLFSKRGGKNENNGNNRVGGASIVARTIGEKGKKRGINPRVRTMGTMEVLRKGCSTYLKRYKRRCANGIEPSLF